MKWFDNNEQCLKIISIEWYGWEFSQVYSVKCENFRGKCVYAEINLGNAAYYNIS